MKATHQSRTRPRNRLVVHTGSWIIPRHIRICRPVCHNWRRRLLPIAGLHPHRSHRGQHASAPHRRPPPSTDRVAFHRIGHVAQVIHFARNNLCTLVLLNSDFICNGIFGPIQVHHPAALYITYQVLVTNVTIWDCLTYYANHSQVRHKY